MAGLRAIVVGGSQAGLLAAIALRGIGCEVTVHERSSRPLQDRGAGIRLHPSLLDLLATRTDVDLTDVSCAVTRQQYLGRAGEVVASEPSAMVFSSWNGLFGTLRGLVPDSSYRLGSRCTGWEDGEDAVTVMFEGGTEESADLVVSADGVTSVGRELISPGAVPRYAGYVAWRGCLPESSLPPSSRALFTGAHSTALLDRSHMNLYLVPPPGEPPVVGRRLVNFIWYRNAEEETLSRWLTDSDGVTRSGSVPPGKVADRVRDELRDAAVELLPPPVVEVVTLTEEPFLQVIYDAEVDRLAGSRACLVGDAGFLARPHLGAGTAKAAESAWALADALVAADADVEGGLRRWESRELGFGHAIVADSARLGDRFQLAGDVVPGDPELRAAVESPLRELVTQPKEV